MIRIFAIGDVMGKPGRQSVEHFLPRIREELKPDFFLANGENAAGGFGITKKIFDTFIDQYKINCVTMGNHWHDKTEIFEFMDHPQIVLPNNMANVDESKYGLNFFETPQGVRVAVINLIGKIFMKGDNRCPYQALESLLNRIPDHVRVRIVDIHGEATSEKQGLARFLDGKASMVYGTHSHVPTADDRIFPGGTAFTTDLGMTGPYESVIGIRMDAAILRMRTGQKHRFEPASDGLWLCGLLAEVDEDTGKCLKLERIRWQKGL